MVTFVSAALVAWAMSKPALAVEPFFTRMPKAEPAPEPAETGVEVAAEAGATTNLVWVPGSTTKKEQLLGDIDKETGQPTRTRTFERFGVRGADLGQSFEHHGRVLFLFGDTIGEHGGDAIGWSTDRDPEDGVDLSFFKRDDGLFLPFKPDGKPLAGFEVPVAGISIAGQPYIAYKSGRTKAVKDTEASSLARFHERTGEATTVREISRLPMGRLIKLSLHHEVGPKAGLPAGGPWIFQWGTAVYHASDVYMAVTPERTYADTGDGTLYFSGMEAGLPTWSPRESAAVPVAANGTLGDVSVTWAEEVGQWIMLYDNRVDRGVMFRHATHPWGPWSEEQQIFDPSEGGYGVFIHHPKSNDRLAGPVIGDENKDDPEAVKGGAYAPYVVERWTRVHRGQLRVYWLLSTWNPYVVVLMRSEFTITP